LQTPGATAKFFREVQHKPILAGKVFKDPTDRFHANFVERIARRWMGMVLDPLTEVERAAGYRACMYFTQLHQRLLTHGLDRMNQTHRETPPPSGHPLDRALDALNRQLDWPRLSLRLGSCRLKIKKNIQEARRFKNARNCRPPICNRQTESELTNHAREQKQRCGIPALGKK
jgi:hypothetical protein